MIKAFISALVMLLGFSCNLAVADIFGVTGDLDIGPAHDFISQDVVCKDAAVLFKMYEKLPHDETKKDYLVQYFTPYVNDGKCAVVPASTAYVVGIKTAMIRSGKGSPASKYVVVRVIIEGRSWYVMPNGLQQTGFDIIKTAQQENRRIGAPLVQ